MQLPDFYMELEWEFQSWVPFLSRFCPSESVRLHPRFPYGDSDWPLNVLILSCLGTKFGSLGDKLRADSSLVGYGSLRLLTSREALRSR